MAGTLFARARPARQALSRGECPPQGDATKAKLEAPQRGARAPGRRDRRRRRRLGHHGGNLRARRRPPALAGRPGCRDHGVRHRGARRRPGVVQLPLVAGARTTTPSSSSRRDAGGVDRSHRFYAVVTPQWRRAVSADHVDWSTAGLRAHYIQRWVTVRGWLLFNSEAATSSLHTVQLVGPGVSRMSAWEIHPVTALDLQDDVLDQQALLPLPGGPDRGEGRPLRPGRTPAARRRDSLKRPRARGSAPPTPRARRPPRARHDSFPGFGDLDAAAQHLHPEVASRRQLERHRGLRLQDARVEVDVLPDGDRAVRARGCPTRPGAAGSSSAPRRSASGRSAAAAPRPRARSRSGRSAQARSASR